MKPLINLADEFAVYLEGPREFTRALCRAIQERIELITGQPYPGIEVAKEHAKRFGWTNDEGHEINLWFWDDKCLLMVDMTQRCVYKPTGP